MMRREEFLKKHPNIKGDMVAYSSDGEKLGKVTALNDDTVYIEKGFFFPRDFAVHYDNIVDIHGSDMIIDQQREALSDWRSESYEGWSREEGLLRGEEINIPLFEEELQARKTARQKGEVHLKKTVHTEPKTITVPLMKEEVVIERTPVTEASQPGLAEKAFHEEETSIPLMEEEVEVVKHKRIREMVHAKKVAHTEQQEINGDVMVEDIEIKTEEGRVTEH